MVGQGRMGKVAPKAQALAGIKPKKSRFFRNLFLTATVAAGLGLGAVGVKRAVNARNAELERQRAELASKLKGTDIDARTQRIFAMYELNPANTNHVQTMEVIQRLSKGMGITPARFMLTIEGNFDGIEGGKFTKFKMDALEHSKTPATAERNERIQEVMWQFNHLPQGQRELIEKMATKRGTNERLKIEVERERQRSGTRSK